MEGKKTRKMTWRRKICLGTKKGIGLEMEDNVRK
jgi:hypothetical protein